MNLLYTPDEMFGIRQMLDCGCVVMRLGAAARRRYSTLQKYGYVEAARVGTNSARIVLTPLGRRALPQQVAQ